MNYADDDCGYGNKVLYRMCHEQPKHDDVDVIYSKFWIIGRAYAAAIERKAGENFDLWNAAEIIKENGQQIDSLIDGLKSIDRTTADNVHYLLNAHKEFTQILKQVTGIDKRSLASKYLHFHAPKCVFIYDSISSSEIRKVFSPKTLPLTKKYDDKYECFVHRCIEYRDTIFEKEINALATPRRIDARLLGYEGKYTSMRT